MITGIPPYSNAMPIECSVRCTCGARYLVFNPDAHSLGNAEGRAKERAEQMGCTFVNSLLSPFVLCGCGESLDFSQAEAVEMVM